jgi:hypothetical protein
MIARHVVPAAPQRGYTAAKVGMASPMARDERPEPPDARPSSAPERPAGQDVDRSEDADYDAETIVEDAIDYFSGNEEVVSPASESDAPAPPG